MQAILLWGKLFVSRVGTGEGHMQKKFLKKSCVRPKAGHIQKKSFHKSRVETETGHIQKKFIKKS